MYQFYIKRIIDIIIALIAIIMLLPVMLIVALFVKFYDKGPIFYSSDRLGKEMEKFKMYKFRSMKIDAPDIRNKDGSTFNSEDDPRITGIGKFIRKTSLDELPQLLNVLKGDMSFVGPRPSPLGNEANYPEYYLKKFKIRPGITGYNQAILRNNSTLEQRYENDVYYTENISFTLDIKIIILTVISVLKSKNVYRN